MQATFPLLASKKDMRYIFSQPCIPLRIGGASGSKVRVIGMRAQPATIILYYHFDNNMGMQHLRMEVDKTVKISSITSIFLCALLIENETQDQFGVRFDGLPLDYDGKM